MEWECTKGPLLVMDKLTAYIKYEAPWYMLFTYDMIIIIQERKQVDDKVELWRKMLDSNGLMISRSNTEYMEFKFSGSLSSEVEIAKIETTWYLNIAG